MHFNNSGAIEYVTSLINESEGASKYMYVYSFGVSDHRKGFYGGLGGALKLKNETHSLIKESKTGGNDIAGAASRYILNVEDIRNGLQEHFKNDQTGFNKNKTRTK